MTTSQNGIEASGWLVYLNGIEVPAISVNVTADVGDIPTASITLPPDITMRRLGALDRVRATVFYYDSIYTRKHGIEPDWRLLFDGEIVDWSYVNTPAGRQLQYTATDMVAVLTQIFPMFISNVSSLVSSTIQTTVSGVSAAVNPVAVTHALFNIGLASGEVIRRPYEFVRNVFRLLLGEGAEENAQSVISTQWFQRWVQRTKMLRRVLPAYDDPKGKTSDGTAGFPILVAAQNSKVISTLVQEGDRIANSSSYYALIQTLFQRVYYEMNAVVAPPCSAVDETTHYVKGPSISAQQAGLTLAIGQHITQPKNFFGVPPKCNVFWPSMVLQHSFSENYATQPTRTYLGNSYMFEILGSGIKNDGLKKIIDNNMTEAYPEEANRLLYAKKDTGDASINISNFLVYPEEFFKGPVYNRMNAPTWFSFLNTAQDSDSTRVHKMYAALEHHRTRLSRRNGAVNMVFNPYVVGGQPCVTIDNITSNLHTFGYVVGVNHSFTQNSATTTVRYTYGQTFDEFFETLITDRAEFGGVDADFMGPAHIGVVEFAPIHPIGEIRDKFQSIRNANAFYKNILWREDEEDVVFDWPKIIGVQDSTGVSPVTLRLGDSNAIPDEQGYTPLYDILPGYREYLTNTRKALEYVSRPVCTLDEYTDFHMEYGTQQGLRLPENTREGKVAPYYVKILDLVQGPGVEPGQMADGNRCSVVEVDTVRNWEARLMRFRQKVYHESHPHLS